MTVEDLKNGKVKLEFGNDLQIKALREAEAKEARRKDAIKFKAMRVNYGIVAICPHCGSSGDYHQYETHSFNDFAEYIGMDDDGDSIYVCSLCDKRITR